MALDFQCQFKYPGGFELDACFTTDRPTTAICGPSGSGKTTVLGLIAGLLRPDSGRISQNGSVLVDTDRRIFLPPQKRQIGLVFQDNLLFPHRTVRANLQYGLKRRPLRPVSFERVVKVLELASLLDRRPATLSGGESRRVALGRAMMRGPAFLMLDEPLTGLDDEIKDRVIEFLERSREEWQLPMLLVSHDQSSVERLADRIIWMREGRLDGEKNGR